MKCVENTEKIMRLYAVTDRAWTGEQSLYQQVEDALKGGITCLQLREKNMNDEDFLAEALKLKSLCQNYKVPLIINDNVEVALKCGADGIHVGQEDMAAGSVRQRAGKDMLLGVSVHSVAEALEAQSNGADYLGVGAMFPTATKDDADVLDYDILKDICSAVHIPVVAIGGINKANLMTLAGSGVNGVALISAVFAAPDIESECWELYRLSEEMVKQ